MHLNRKILLTVFSFVFVLAACTPAATTNGTQEADDNTNAITITSQGEVTSEPNTSVINVAIEVENDTAKEAQEQVEALGKYLKEVAKEHKIPEDHIKTKNFHIREMRDYKANKITGYRVSHALQVEVRETDNLGKIIDALTKKNSILIRNIEYKLTDDKQNEKENEALSLAIQNAKDKAKVIAKELDIEIGGIQDVVTSSVRARGYHQSIEEAKLMDSESASFEMPQDDVTVTSTVQVSFKIKQ